MSLLDDLKKYQQMSQVGRQQSADQQLYNQMMQYMQNWGMNWGIPINSTQEPAGSLQRAEPCFGLLPEETCIKALVGWRRWTVSMFGEELYSNNGTPWKPYERQAAVCSLTNSCQAVSCGCGIYAYKERIQAETLENAPSQVTHVWGEVMLWGRVIEHKLGYRAQFAYPKAFVNTGGIAQRMATVYGVKVIA